MILQSYLFSEKASTINIWGLFSFYKLRTRTGDTTALRDRLKSNSYPCGFFSEDSFFI